MKNRRFHRGMPAVAAVLTVVLFACGGGGGGGGAASQPAAANIEGVWSIASTLTSNTCGDSNGGVEFFSATITHNGTSNNFSATFYQGGTFIVSCSGTISGTSVSISDCSYPDGIGTTTSNVSGTLNTSLMTILGTDSWTWSAAGSQGSHCSGQSSWGATLSPTGGGGGGASTQVQITTAESEPNDTRATANIITGTTPVTISGSYGGTDDYYELNFANSTTRTITLNGLSSDLDLRLLNSSGNQLSASVASGSASESLTWSFTGGVKYYIHVDPYLSPANTNYILRIQ